MAESKVECSTSTRPDCASSPPPNCSICLGPFSNQCVSDSCRHMFCFKCLLEWSRIKAECPLCKIPFKSIIHNVRSDSEYDQHIVQTTQAIPNEIIHHLPTSSTRHQFHFRTTFTVDTRGEHAIQQMLLTHPLTNGGQISFSGYSPRRFLRRRRDSSATTFRRSIYNNNLWVSAMPDVTGTYRDVSPSFFRNYPGARTRLAPWLNRELNALLYENTPLIMHLVDQIMEWLLRHHICSRAFRNFLAEYLGQKTDHFVHEFYNFMRSPFDMIGYDRHIVYTERPRSPAPFIDVESDSDNSDVILVDVQPLTRPEENVVIDLLDSDSDNSVLMSNWPTPALQMNSNQPMVISSDDDEGERAPPAEPTVANTTNRSNSIVGDNVENEQQSETQTKPMLPLKLRLKHKRLSKQKMKKRKYHRSSSSSSTSSSSSSSSSSESNSDNDYRKKRKRKQKKRRHGKSHKDIWVISSGGSATSDSDDSELEENLPLSLVLNKTNKKLKHKKKKKHSQKKSKSKNRDKDRKRPKLHNPDCVTENCTNWNSELDAFSSAGVNFNVEDLPSCSYSSQSHDSPGTSAVDLSSYKIKKLIEHSSSDEDEDSDYDKKPLVKSEVHDVRHLRTSNNNNNNLNLFNGSVSFDEEPRSSNIDVVLKNTADMLHTYTDYKEK